MKIKKEYILLSLIILISVMLRFWHLGQTPASPDWDEVSLGYNAYSVLQTGRDEYGKLFPIVLQSFNDFKPALYMYLIIPFIKILDLSVFVVRLPSAILGVLTVFATYFLVKELFNRKDLALVSSFLLAISPWHIQFSRIAFESNLGLSLNVFLVLFFLKGLKKPIFLIPSVIFAGLSLYAYQADKIFTPILVLLLVVIYRKDLFLISKKYLISLVILGLIISIEVSKLTYRSERSFSSSLTYKVRGSSNIENVF